MQAPHTPSSGPILKDTLHMKNKSLVVLVAAAVALATVAAFALWPLGKTADPYQLHPDDARVVAEGAKVYEIHCASCHGAQLEGQPEWRSRNAAGILPAPPHDASGHTWHHPDELLFRITKLGVAAVIGDKDYKTAMPAFAGVLSDGQIIAALSWIKAQWPAEVRKDNDLVNAQSR
jgi:S-disulfanyl-L-cysteine oxidoreductase SoxD